MKTKIVYRQAVELNTITPLASKLPQPLCVATCFHNGSSHIWTWTKEIGIMWPCPNTHPYYLLIGLKVQSLNIYSSSVIKLFVVAATNIACKVD